MAIEVIKFEISIFLFTDLDRESLLRRSDVSSGICIIEHPSPNSITVPINKRIHLTFHVAPDPALTYQWIRGDTWLQGQTSVELKVTRIMDAENRTSTYLFIRIHPSTHHLHTCTCSNPTIFSVCTHPGIPGHTGI